ncbi:MAG: NADH-quinone oxidoreductase subunit J [Deltaproteobacteria bacterium]|nr:MAG: NADH-quinone oxidoreductase subunit J [Deltaproteobacteria bacterium]
MDIATALFYLVAIITVGSAAVVAFSRNIIYSAFSLMGTFAGVAGIYVFLGADFVAAVQLLIYVGGILVLILFAVMLTHRITDVEITNRAAGRIPALLAIGIFIFLLVQTIRETSWAKAKEILYAPTTARIGDLFLENYLLPFELASLVLLAALIGAVVLSRKELRE